MTTFELLNFQVLDTKGACQAMVDVQFDGSLSIYSVKLFTGKKGLFISMPSHKRGKSYQQTCSIDDKELRKAVENAVVKRYILELKNRNSTT